MEELILLRREYGIGYHEAYNVLPSWYIGVLLDGTRMSDDEDDSPDSREIAFITGRS